MTKAERTQLEALQKDVGEVRLELDDKATKADIRWLKWGITLLAAIMTGGLAVLAAVL